MNKPSSKTYANTAPQQLAFIGLGVMGYAMAGHLAAAGHQVTVYNRNAEKSQRWAQEFSGSAAPTPRAAAENADIVFCCVGNDADVRAVVLGDSGAFAGMKPGAVLVDHTSTSAQLARELAAQARDRQLEFVDAPVSGGQAGAEQGQLAIMCGGSVRAVEQVAGVMQAYARATTHIGDVGSGQLAKMVNQICLAGLIQGLAEGLAFGRAAQLDVAKVIEVISLGAAGSWQMTHRGPTMLEDRFDFGFAVDWMRKDLGVCLDTAKHLGATLPVTALVDQFYADIQRAGGGRLDTSSLITRLTPSSNPSAVP